MEDYRGDYMEDSLETAVGVPEPVVPEFIWDHEPATGLHPIDADTESTDLEERSETSPGLVSFKCKFKQCANWKLA